MEQGNYKTVVQSCKSGKTPSVSQPPTGKGAVIHVHRSYVYPVFSRYSPSGTGVIWNRLQFTLEDQKVKGNGAKIHTRFPVCGS